MKKIFFYLFAIIAFVACSETEAEINLDTTTATFSTEGGSTIVTFTATDAWTAESINNPTDAWCSVSPTNGSAGTAKITITTTTNDSTYDRTATVVIKSGTNEKTIAVSQKQKDAIIIAKDSYNISEIGDEIEIEVGHNINLNIKIDGDWITQKQTRALETSRFTFVVAENMSDKIREGSITFSSAIGDISQVISITQDKAVAYKIYYTSTDGNIVELDERAAFGATILSNTYENGKGVITFDNDITSIGETAFYNCRNLSSITIPNTVTWIGDRAFSYCIALTNVSIPNSVTSIGESTFFHCESLTKITIPDSVTKIGDNAFVSCTSLNSITIPDSITSIRRCTFGGCTNLSSITIPNSVTSIGESAFFQCYSLTSITIPDSVTKIGEGAFNCCTSLKSITIPNGVSSIENRTFCDCESLTSITIPNSVISIGDDAFKDCKSLTNLSIPDSVTSIGEEAFYNCSNLSSIAIPNSVTLVRDGVFACCELLSAFYGKYASADNRCLIVNEELKAFAPADLTTYTIPNGISSIGGKTFYGYTSLKSITIPNSVTSIGAFAFTDCKSLISVYCRPTTPPQLNENRVFNDNAYNRKIYVPKESVDSYKRADEWEDFADDIEGYDFTE